MELLGVPHLNVFLLHKPRRTKGNWTKVELAERLRMTTATGKWLKLEIRASNFMFDVKNVRSQIKVRLLLEDGEESQRYYLEEWKIYEFVVEIELKLFQTGSGLRFQVTTTTTDGKEVQAWTQPFTSKNSGTTRANNAINVSPPRENSSPDSNIHSDSMTSYPSSPGPTEGEIIRGNVEVQGVVKAFEFSQLSDLRLKTNISDISDALKIVSSLQGRRYEWKSDTETEGTGGNRVIGLIAQEVRKVAPEVVHEDPETGILSVSYSELTPILIEAFKDYLKDYKSNQSDVRSSLQALQEKLDGLLEANEQMGEEKMKNHRPEHIEQFEVEEGPSSALIPNLSKTKPSKMRKLFVLCKAGLFGSMFTFVFSLLLIGLTDLYDFSSHHEKPPPSPGPQFNDSYQNFNQSFQHFGPSHNDKRPERDWSGISTDMIINIAGTIGILVSVIGSIICSIFLCSRKDDIEVTTETRNVQSNVIEV